MSFFTHFFCLKGVGENVAQWFIFESDFRMSSSSIQVGLSMIEPNINKSTTKRHTTVIAVHWPKYHIAFPKCFPADLPFSK